MLEEGTREEGMQKLFATSSVVFLFTYQGDQFPESFTKIAMQMQADATFAAIKGSAPSLAKLEQGKKIKYMVQALSSGINAPDEGIPKIEDFIKNNNYPLVSSLDSHNFKHLGSLNKLMVIAIVDYKDTTASKKMINELDAAASAMSLSDTDKFIFGHLDGVQWKMFAKQYDAAVTSLLLLDLAKDVYHTTAANTDTREAISAILTSYLDGSAIMKKVPTKGFFTDIQKKLTDYYPYSLLCLVPIALIILSLLVQYPDDTKKSKKD